MKKRKSLSVLKEIPADIPLREFFVDWMNVPAHQFRRFRKCLSTAKREEELQSFLAENPWLLAVQLAGGHGRWVIPKKRLGAELVPDFLVGERSSAGFEWFVVELKSPKAKMFTKAGDPSKYLNRAISQIHACRNWLETHQNYAAQPPTEGGLGLTDISARLDGLILIGRSIDIDESTNGRRREIARSDRIRIHSYDWLLGSGQLTNLPVRRIAD